MAGYPVTGDEYRQIDRRMMEIKRQLNQNAGSPVQASLVLDGLQRLIELGERHSSTEVTTTIDPEVDLQQLSQRKYLAIQCVSVLKWYGIRTLQDLTHYTEAQVAEMYLVGAKRISAIRLLLGDAGLQFRIEREDDEWRRLHNGPIRYQQLLTLSPGRMYTNRIFEEFERLGLLTYADYAAAGREGIKQCIGNRWLPHYSLTIDKVFSDLETPAY